MMKRLVPILMYVLLAVGQLYAQHDPSKYDQFASMEYKQWDFSPTDYYYSRYWGKILDLPWPLSDIYGWLPTTGPNGPGWHDRGQWIPFTGLYIGVVVNPYAAAVGHWDAAFHADGYVNESWRQYYSHRTAAAASAVLYKAESNRQDRYWADIRSLDLVTFADRSGTLSGVIGPDEVTAAERQQYIDVIFKAESNLENQRLSDDIMDEFHALQEQISVIRQAHMDNARKVVSMEELNKEFRVLAERAAKHLINQYYDKAWQQFAGDSEDMKLQRQLVQDIVKMLDSSGRVQSLLNSVNLDKL